MREAREVAAVLHGERIVEPQVLADRGQRLGIGLRPRDGDGGVGGDDAHEDEDDEGRPEKRRERAKHALE